MICLNSKRNPKLLETFNNDPYADTIVKTSTTELHLVLGYLSIDSQFFENIESPGAPIDLSHINELYLIKVLRSLYGDQLIAYGVRELKQIYDVLQELSIHEYVKNLKEYILENPGLMDNFELIEFCFSNNLLEREIRQHHYELNLSVFSSTKNYLQLNKISELTLNSLLVEYCEIHGESADSTINSIVENYIGRNNLRPNEFFTHPANQPLLVIWEKFHHSISYLINAQEKVRQSQIINQDETKKSMIYSPTQQFSLMTSMPTLPNVGMYSSLSSGKLSLPMKRSCMSPMNSNLKAEIEKKDEMIKKLEETVQLNQSIIENLKKEIDVTKKQIFISSSASSNKLVSPELHQDLRLLQFEQNARKKQFQEVIGINTGDDYDVSLIEPPLNQNRKVVREENKEVKTMNKLNTRGGRKIFS